MNFFKFFIKFFIELLKVLKPKKKPRKPTVKSSYSYTVPAPLSDTEWAYGEGHKDNQELDKSIYSKTSYSYTVPARLSDAEWARGEGREYNQELDYLYKASIAGHSAKDAVIAKKYDKAWGLYHEQKHFYMLHSNRSGFTARQALAIDSHAHEGLANILRLENKHYDALVHILYWVSAHNDYPIKRHQQKLAAYFRRCKFKNTTLEEAIRFTLLKHKGHPFELAKSKVLEWREKEINQVTH